MAAGTDRVTFSEHYATLRTYRIVAREDEAAIREEVVQAIWYDQLFKQDGLITDDGRSIAVISPGWWNRNEGPDFQGAEIELRGKRVQGDIEIHLEHAGWYQHGHHEDPRYDNVKLHVVLSDAPPAKIPATSTGRTIPTLSIQPYLTEDIHAIADRIEPADEPYDRVAARGTCAALVEMYGSGRLEKLLAIAGEWRMLDKARAIRQRVEYSGPSQALYESFLSACGYSQFKHQFRAIAHAMHYERAQQIARQDPFILEAAFLQMAGLLPAELENTSAVPHFARLRSARRDHLGDLRSLPLQWKRNGVRPVNYPERRLAGAAQFIARHCQRASLHHAIDAIWREEMKPLERRRAFEALFPGAMGFWGTRCSWTGKKLSKAVAPIGPSRVRSIIGNVFIPYALAQARQTRNRGLEKRAFEFFEKLPKESDNHLLKIMVPRIFGDAPPPKLTFRTQQGLLQMYHDWCSGNPSCENCRVIPSLDLDDRINSK